MSAFDDDAGPSLHRWSVEEVPNERHVGMVDARVVSECDLVCEVSGAVICGDWGRHEIHTARARLIAAAPDLLSACMGLIRARDRFDTFCENEATEAEQAEMEALADAAFDGLRAAVAKATGASK